MANSHGIMIPFLQIVLETGYALEEQALAILNMLIVPDLNMVIKTLLYFLMPVHLTVYTARIGTTKLKLLNLKQLL